MVNLSLLLGRVSVDWCFVDYITAWSLAGVSLTGCHSEV